MTCFEAITNKSCLSHILPNSLLNSPTGFTAMCQDQAYQGLIPPPETGELAEP